MSLTDEVDYERFILPPSLLSRADLSRLASEVEQVDQEVMSAKIRHQSLAPTTLSDQLQDFLSANQFQISDINQRAMLLTQLRKLVDHVLVVHTVFASAADTEVIRTLVEWLRQSVHPQAVISVGLQPSLIGGIYVRTPNHVYDLSVKAQLSNKRHLLVESIEGLNGNL